ncbi:MAG: porin [Gammaproteobacteria bacterium]|nr:porin [Gammaproteobacteria bacterium]MBU1775386.1 porin [Gammaproteobacteria bacterium]MBU1969457.1 porin [Gammaproteobacteria bacterium]
MQKKLIALAVAAAFSAPAFADNANFTFYGTADLSYDMVNTGTAANGTKGTTKRVVSSNVSKFGFKGAEDLGGGLAAVWQIEQQINIDDAAKNTFASRNTFAGLKGDFGTVLLGIHDTPYKLTTRKLDVFGDSIADNRALLGGITGTSAAAAFDGRQNNVLAYISPAMSGLTAAIAAVNLTEGNKLDTDESGSALSLGLMYSAAPFYAGLGYEKHSLDHVAVGASEKATKVGFGFSQDMFSVGAVIEKTTDNLAAAQENKYGHSAVYLSGKMKVGSGAVKLAYAKAGEIGSGAAKVANSGASMLSVGYDHKMSKQTTLYALYSKLSNDDAAAYKFTQNSGASSTLAGTGASPSVVSLGMKHTF